MREYIPHEISPKNKFALYQFVSLLYTVLLHNDMLSRKAEGIDPLKP